MNLERKKIKDYLRLLVVGGNLHDGSNVPYFLVPTLLCDSSHIVRVGLCDQ